MRVSARRPPGDASPISLASSRVRPMRDMLNPLFNSTIRDPNRWSAERCRWGPSPSLPANFFSRVVRDHAAPRKCTWFARPQMQRRWRLCCRVRRECLTQTLCRRCLLYRGRPPSTRFARLKDWECRMNSSAITFDGQVRNHQGGTIMDFVRPAAMIAAVVVACFVIPLGMFMALHRLLA